MSVTSVVSIVCSYRSLGTALLLNLHNYLLFACLFSEWKKSLLRQEHGWSVLELKILYFLGVFGDDCHFMRYE